MWKSILETSFEPLETVIWAVPRVDSRYGGIKNYVIHELYVKVNQLETHSLRRKFLSL